MDDKRFFCIRGFMKSGTNWLGNLLDSHQEINVLGEFHWHRIVSQFNQNQKTLALFTKSEEYSSKSRQYFEEMIRKCMLEAANPEAKLIGDRTPNSITPVTLRAVPHISIIRDGRDVLISRLFHLYNHPRVTSLFDRVPEMADCLREFQSDPWYFQKHPKKLLLHHEMVVDSINLWKEHLKKDEQAERSYPNLKIRFVKYEDLHRDAEGEREKLFEFLDVDPTLASAIEGKLKPGFEKERPGKFLRKGTVGDWENYFDESVKSLFNDIAADELMRYGYIDSLDW